ncbi:MAG: hypothetical protein ACRD3L_05735 [Terriglobales bacterium]
MDGGKVSKNIYHNAQLGFSYEFPHGWVVNDKSTQQRAHNERHQFAWADDLSARWEKPPSRHCSRGLLLVTKYPEEMHTNDFNPLGFLAVADPQCAPTVRFPTSVKDTDAVERVAGQLGLYVKTPTINSRGAARLRVFESNGRVVITVLERLNFMTYEPGISTNQDLLSETTVMQAGDCWIVLMFLGESDADLAPLRASQIRFDVLSPK